MCLVRSAQRGRDDLTQNDRVHLDLRAWSTLDLPAWTLEIPPMRIPTLLPFLDRLPSDPHTHLGLPAAFEHAQPLRQWRESWSPAYEALLALLRQRHSAENRAVRTFIQILQLHETYPAALVHRAIEQAVAGQTVSLEGVRFCLNRLLDPTPVAQPLDLAGRPRLVPMGSPPPRLSQYDRFLGEVLQ